MKVRIVVTAQWQCSWPELIRIVRIVVMVLVFVAIGAVGGGFLGLPVR